jgi:hypothetical protein
MAAPRAKENSASNFILSNFSTYTVLVLLAFLSARQSISFTVQPDAFTALPMTVGGALLAFGPVGIKSEPPQARERGRLWKCGR